MYHLNYKIHGEEFVINSITRPYAIESDNDSVTFIIEREDGDMMKLKLWYNKTMSHGYRYAVKIVNHEYWKLGTVNISHSISEE